MHIEELEIDPKWSSNGRSTVALISRPPPKAGIPSVTLSRLDYSETGGGSSIGSRALTLMFFLTDAPMSDFPVKLRAGPLHPGFIPESVTIPAGSSSFQISIVASPVRGSLYTLTATDPHGVAQTLIIYLT
jgi:hypothetical protein